MHGAAENTEIYSAFRKMGGDREPVRPRADNRYIDDFSHDTRYVRNNQCIVSHVHTGNTIPGENAGSSKKFAGA